MMDCSNLEVVIATRNPGKMREINEALRGLRLKLRVLDDFPDTSTVEEVGATYRENALLKALGYAKQTGLLTLADDSGLEVDALGGKPGVLSARFGGEGVSDEERRQKLLKALSKRPNEPRTARFVSFIAVAGQQPAGPQTQTSDIKVLTIAEGTCDGFIAEEPRGEHGFGYDPVFVPIGYQATFGELPSEVKNKISHRALALAAIRKFFESLT